MTLAIAPFRVPPPRQTLSHLDRFINVKPVVSLTGENEHIPYLGVRFRGFDPALRLRGFRWWRWDQFAIRIPPLGSSKYRQPANSHPSGSLQKDLKLHLSVIGNSTDRLEAHGLCAFG